MYVHLAMTNTQTHFRSRVTTSLNAYSHAYIFIALIPVITSFITRTLLSVSCADFNLDAGRME